MNSSTILITDVGTALYRAPEVAGSQYTSTVDCWSVGCIVYRLIKGEVFFQNVDAIYRFKYMGEPSPASALVDCGGDCPDFVGKLITADPDRRLCAATALDHPWMLRFSGTDKNHQYTISTSLRTRFDKVLSIDNLKGRLQNSGPNIGIETMSQGSLEPDITLSTALPKLSDLHVTAVKKSQRPPKKANVKLQQAGFAGESTASR